MRTSYELLPVYNELYDLNLTQKDIIGIKKDLELTNNLYLKCTMHRTGHIVTLNNRGSYYYSSDEIALQPTDKVRNPLLNEKYYVSTRKENFIFNWELTKEEGGLVSFMANFCEDIKDEKNKKDHKIFNNIDEFKTYIIDNILCNKIYLGHSLETKDFRFFADLTDSFYDENKSLKPFVGAYDVSPDDHIKVQATIQKYIDSCISKTINLPSTATPESFSQAALDYAPYLKGFTVYRAGSKGNEPLQAIPLTEENIEKYMKKDDKEMIMAFGDKCTSIGGECAL